jgi:hypothetical protein
MNSVQSRNSVREPRNKPHALDTLEILASCKSSQEPNQGTLLMIGCHVVTLEICASCLIHKVRGATVVLGI